MKETNNVEVDHILHYTAHTSSCHVPVEMRSTAFEISSNKIIRTIFMSKLKYIITTAN